MELKSHVWCSAIIKNNNSKIILSSGHWVDSWLYYEPSAVKGWHVPRQAKATKSWDLSNNNLLSSSFTNLCMSIFFVGRHFESRRYYDEAITSEENVFRSKAGLYPHLVVGTERKNCIFIRDRWPKGFFNDKLPGSRFSSFLVVFFSKYIFFRISFS